MYVAASHTHPPVLCRVRSGVHGCGGCRHVLLLVLNRPACICAAACAAAAWRSWSAASLALLLVPAERNTPPSYLLRYCMSAALSTVHRVPYLRRRASLAGLFSARPRAISARLAGGLATPIYDMSALLCLHSYMCLHCTPSRLRHIFSLLPSSAWDGVLQVGGGPLPLQLPYPTLHRHCSCHCHCHCSRIWRAD